MKHYTEKTDPIDELETKLSGLGNLPFPVSKNIGVELARRYIERGEVTSAGMIVSLYYDVDLRTAMVFNTHIR